MTTRDEARAFTAGAACHDAHPKRSAPAGAAEARDERELAEARANDAALVAYEAKWRRRLTRLQRAHRARWHVPGLSDEEVRDALTLRLIEAVKAPPEQLDARRRPGRELGLSILIAARAALKQECFRRDAIPMDLTRAPLLQHGESHEAAWLEREDSEARSRAFARAELGLSRVQRRWLDALRESAARGGFFEASDEPNLSAASRVLGRDRSSALRAYRELARRCQREREREPL